MQVAGSRFCVRLAIIPRSDIKNLITATGFSSMRSASSRTETLPGGNCTVFRDNASCSLYSLSADRSRFFKLPRRCVSSADRPFRDVLPSFKLVLPRFLLLRSSSSVFAAATRGGLRRDAGPSSTTLPRLPGATPPAGCRGRGRPLPSLSGRSTDATNLSPSVQSTSEHEK